MSVRQHQLRVSGFLWWYHGCVTTPDNWAAGPGTYFDSHTSLVSRRLQMVSACLWNLVSWIHTFAIMW
jgi:hypothetical protein